MSTPTQLTCHFKGQNTCNECDECDEYNKYHKDTNMIKMIKIQAADPTHREQPLQLQVQQDREHGDVRERQLQSASGKRAWAGSERTHQRSC
jgi:hypothetical protein